MPRRPAVNPRRIQTEVLAEKLRANELNGPQMVISYLIERMIGHSIPNPKVFMERFPIRNALEDGADPPIDSLFRQCFQSLLVNGDFSQLKEELKPLLANHILEEFCDFHMKFPLSFMEFLAENTDIRSKFVKFVIKESEFCVMIGPLLYLTFSYDDRKNPENIFAW